jgi:4-alpha-glucanotransferase
MVDFDDIARRWGIEPGYHDVFGTWHDASAKAVEAIVVALSQGCAKSLQLRPNFEPLRAFQGDGRRHWALAVQLYSLRSTRNGGIGDFGDLKQLIEIAAKQGVAAIGLNPLHALFADRPEDASPYSPNSRLFLNVFAVDIAALPELRGGAPPSSRGASSSSSNSASSLIDYRPAGAWKLAALRAAYGKFRTAASQERRADFDSFRAEQGEALLRFSCFEVLREKFSGTPWRDWPPPWNNPDIAALEKFYRDHRAACEFHEYMQWNADRQLRDCKNTAHRCGMPIGLYIDFAVGIHPDGADAWSHQASVLNGISVGAPPDELNTAGQDWGLAPFNPASLPANDFAALRELLRAIMRHAGAIRIDHVLGLNRTFMIPHGMAPRDGVYVRFPFESMLRVIAEESNRARCVVIGEDLGTVPEGFREVLTRYGIWTYRVMMFERDGSGSFRHPETYPENAVAAFNTHDMPTLRGWLAGHDLRVKRGLGLDPGETDGQRRHSWDKLRWLIGERAGEWRDDELAAVMALLAATPSRLVVVAIEDVLGIADQPNVPGTVYEHPNWRRRLPVSVEELAENAELRKIAGIFTKAGRGARGR